MNGLPPAACDGFEAGFGQRAVGDREGEFGDDDVRQCLAADIHTLPEAIDTEQHPRWVSRNCSSNLGGRKAASLHEQSVVVAGEKWAELRRGAVQE